MVVARVCPAERDTTCELRVKTGSWSGGRADWRRGFAALPWRMPNFVLLDTSQPDITQLLVAMLQAQCQVCSTSWRSQDVHGSEINGIIAGCITLSRSES